jgi:hypothetical protein
MKAFRIAVASILMIGVVNVAGQKPKTDSTTSIDGVVLASASGDPIAGARVMLLKEPGIITRSGPSPGVELPLELDFHYMSTATFTDADGRFAFTNIDPKVFGMVVGANGYVRREFERDDFPESGKRLVVRMTATGTVNGVVRGDAGRPLADVSVQLLRYVYDDSGQRIVKPFGSVRTNDRGEYRLYDITPGRYYVRAGTSSKPTDNAFAESVSPLFYPGVADVAQASVVEVDSAGELGGLDFNLKHQESHRIRGRVIDEEPNSSPDSSKSLHLYYLGGGFPTGDDVGSDWSYARPSADGTFEFRDIVPGLYAIAYSDSPVRGLVTVRVGNSDIENIKMTLTETTVNGRIRMEHGPITEDIRKYMGFHLVPALLNGALSGDNLLAEFSALESRDLDEDGKFVIEDALPLDYRLEVGWLPAESYIKSARFGGVDILSQPFHSGDAGAVLEIVIASDSGSIAGTVVDEKFRPVRGAQAVLVPERARNRVDLYHSAETDRDGKFSFEGIAPGDYKLFAWESIEENSWFDPEVIRRFESRGKSVHVGESSKQAVEVKLISAPK